MCANIKYSQIALILFPLFAFAVNAQNNAIALSGAYMKLAGGGSVKPIYVVVNQSNIAGITRTSGHIISEGDYNFVKWNMGSTNGSYVFPFGYSTTDYLPFTFKKTAGNANLAISTYATASANTPLANTVTTMQPSGPVSDASNMVVDRWWRMQVENGVTAPTADLTFSYRGSENTIAGISCPADVIAAQYWNGTGWYTPFNPGSSCATAGIGTAQANGVSVFTSISSQPFILVKTINPLPVELISFSASCVNGKITLKWSTASEQNNNFFIIERGNDALNYESIGVVNGAGNSSTILNYSFLDTDPFSGTSYYRLKQTDFNGSSKYYGLISVLACDENSISVFPSISNGFFTVTGNGIADIIIYNLLGQKIFLATSQVLPFSMNLCAYADGNYILQAKINGTIENKKIIINK